MPRQATAFSRLVLGTSSDVKPLTLSNVALGSKTELSPLALHVRSGSKTDSNREGSMSALPSTADFTKVAVRSAKCRQQRTSRTTSRRRSGKPALIFRCFQIDDMGPVPCVNFLGEQSTRSANAKPSPRPRGSPQEQINLPNAVTKHICQG